MILLNCHFLGHNHKFRCPIVGTRSRESARLPRVHFTSDTRMLSRTSANYRFLWSKYVSGKEIIDFRRGIARYLLAHLVSPRHMASACYILYSNTDIMLLGLDRCSSVMRLRLMIRDRIFLWINERSTQIVARHEGENGEADYHKKKITFENRRSRSDPPAAVAGSRLEIDLRPLDFTRASPPREILKVIKKIFVH